MVNATLGVAGAVGVAVEGGDREAEPVGLDLRQLGDVRRDLALDVVDQVAVHLARQASMADVGIAPSPAAPGGRRTGAT